MTRLNVLIAENASLQDSLANDNFNAETAFMAKLKDMEASSLVMGTYSLSLLCFVCMLFFVLCLMVV